MLDGSVTVEVLLLVQKHKATFLELLETASGVDNNDAELSVVQRIEEIEEFYTVRENVGRFIAMCDVVPPGELRRKKIVWTLEEPVMLLLLLPLHLSLYTKCLSFALKFWICTILNLPPDTYASQQKMKICAEVIYWLLVL